jgi:predicted Zn-dependent protease
MRKKFLKIIIGLIGSILFALPNPLLFSKGGNLYALTNEEERQLGEQTLREVQRHYTLIRDPILLNYLNQIGQEILRQASPLPYPFHFYLIKDPELNAFSVPGGHIFVSTGIIEVMDEEGELAALLGHEITHVLHHHVSKQIDQQKKVGLGTLATALLGIFAGDPRITAAVLTGSLATAQTLALKYSREDEEDADTYGFKYMAKDGFDPKYMVELFEKLRRWGSFGSEGVPTYLQTHPLTADRMAHTEDLLHQYASQGPWVRKSSDAFRRFETVILTKYGNIQRAKNHFQTWAKESHSLYWVYYGQGWIDIQEGNLDSAKDQFEKALELKPNEPYLLRDLGETYYKKGDLNLAMEKLGQAAILNPSDGLTAFYLGQVYEEKGQNSLALENFQRSLLLGNEGEDLYYQLGMAYGKLNNLSQAHYYFGRSFLIKGDRAKALFHFKNALRYVGNVSGQKELIEKEIKKIEPDKKKEKKDPALGGTGSSPE